MGIEQSESPDKTISLDKKQIKQARRNLRDFADEITGYICSITQKSPEEINIDVDPYFNPQNTK